MRNYFLGALALILAAPLTYAQQAELPSRSPQYARVQSELQKGWNTWDTSTVAGEVLLPQGLEIRLGLKQSNTVGSSEFLPAALIGRQGKNDEQVVPGPHAYDGSYNELKIIWRGYQVQLQAAHEGSDLVMLVTPLAKPHDASLPITAVISTGLLWNRPGTVSKGPHGAVATMPGATIPIYSTGKESNDPYVPVIGPYLAEALGGPMGISTGTRRSLLEIQAIVERQRLAYERHIAASGQNAAVRDAVESIIAWDTIYEPHGQRVITPVSRIWNSNWGGYVLFEWDTFFAATIASVGDRDLAYANVLEDLE